MGVPGSWVVQGSYVESLSVKQSCHASRTFQLVGSFQNLYVSTQNLIPKQMCTLDAILLLSSCCPLHPFTSLRACPSPIADHVPSSLLSTVVSEIPLLRFVGTRIRACQHATSGVHMHNQRDLLKIAACAGWWRKPHAIVPQFSVNHIDSRCTYRVFHRSTLSWHAFQSGACGYLTAWAHAGYSLEF